MPLNQALDNLVHQAHLSVALGPQLSGGLDPKTHMIHSPPMVSVRWHNVTAKQAIVALCENYDLQIVKNSATGTIQIRLKE